MPNEKVDEVREMLKQILDDNRISVTPVGHPPVLSAPSPLDEELVSAIEKTSAEFWPGVPVVPAMSPGATDGSHLRNAGIPTYGHSGLMGDADDVRTHGKDERIAKKAFFEGGEYLYRLVKRLSGGG